MYFLASLPTPLFIGGVIVVLWLIWAITQPPKDILPFDQFADVVNDLLKRGDIKHTRAELNDEIFAITFSTEVDQTRFFKLLNETFFVYGNKVWRLYVESLTVTVSALYVQLQAVPPRLHTYRLH